MVIAVTVPASLMRSGALRDRALQDRATWIVVKHLAGPRAHRIDQFQLAGTEKLVVGRSGAANIVFDGPREDMISRRHAVIRVVQGDPPRFTVADLGSANGVRVNGQGIAGEKSLQPGDIIELSPGGAAFSITIEPEPDPVPPADDRPAVEPGRGRRLLGLYGGGAALVVVLGAAGLLLAVQRHAPPAAPKPVAVAIDPEPVAPEPAPIVVAAPRPARNPAAATVAISARWRVYDRFTGKPVFQKVLSTRGQRLPCFVDLGDHRIVPWLTTEDEDRTNLPIGGETAGTGFLVNAQGSLVTAKRLAAGWTAPYPAWQGRAALFKLQRSATQAASHQLIDLGADSGLPAWVPADGALLFHARVPAQIGVGTVPLDGRNDAIGVVLGQGHDALPGRILRLAAEDDLAELRIDADAPLPAVELATETGSAGDAPIGQAAPGRLDGAPIVAPDGTVLGIAVSSPTGAAHAYPADAIRTLVQTP